MLRYYLKPIESQNQKGFGHNAEVEVRKDGTKVLYSYLRKMAKITPNGSLVRLVGHGKEEYKGEMKSLNDSPVVMRHLVAFCVANGLPAITKKAWNEMPRLGDR